MGRPVVGAPFAQIAADLQVQPAIAAEAKGVGQTNPGIPPVRYEDMLAKPKAV